MSNLSNPKMCNWNVVSCFFLLYFYYIYTHMNTFKLIRTFDCQKLNTDLWIPSLVHSFVSGFFPLLEFFLLSYFCFSYCLFISLVYEMMCCFWWFFSTLNLTLWTIFFVCWVLVSQCIYNSNENISRSKKNRILFCYRNKVNVTREKKTKQFSSIPFDFVFFFAKPIAWQPEHSEVITKETCGFQKVLFFFILALFKYSFVHIINCLLVIFKVSIINCIRPEKN